MPDLYFSVRLADGKELCMAPVSREVFEANNAYDLGDDCGYFIFEYDTHAPSAGIEILGKAASYTAASRLIDLYTAAAGQPVGISLAAGQHCPYRDLIDNPGLSPHALHRPQS